MAAREIARELGIERKEVNRLLYGYPFVRDRTTRTCSMSLSHPRYSWDAHGRV